MLNGAITKNTTVFHLFTRHQNRIYGYILTLMPHSADTEDIMQETASVAWEKFETFEEGTDFAAWLKKIAFHKVMDYREPGRRCRKPSAWCSGHY